MGVEPLSAADGEEPHADALGEAGSTATASSAASRARSTDRSIELLRWPEDRDRRDELMREGRLRLLLVGPEAMPPGRVEGEDWIRLPADERDVSARLLHLAQQVRTEQDLQPEDISVEEGLVRYRSRCVALSPSEACIVRVLAERPGQLVARSELIELLWGGEERREHSLDSRLFIARRKLAGLGLTIHTKRGFGFILTATGSGHE